MSLLNEFAEENELKMIRNDYFTILWKSTKEESKYYITNDLEFTKIFYAKNDYQAIKIYMEGDEENDK